MAAGGLVRDAHRAAVRDDCDEAGHHGDGTAHGRTAGRHGRTPRLGTRGSVRNAQQVSELVIHPFSTSVNYLVSQLLSHRAT